MHSCQNKTYSIVLLSCKYKKIYSLCSFYLHLQPPYRPSRKSYPRQRTIVIQLGKGFTFIRGVIRDSRSRRVLARGVTYLVKVKELLGRRTRRVYRRSARGSFHGYGELFAIGNHYSLSHTPFLAPSPPLSLSLSFSPCTFHF